MTPHAIDLFCGLGGWTDGLLAEGYRVIGFDNEQHVYGSARYPAQLVIQDVLTLHGSQFKDAALIVASPPCQEFSYMAMPWTRAKEKAQALRDGRDDPKRLTALFDACFRIQREACEAAGHHIPLVVENVCGAQKWVGRARWHYGSFFLWGDVPALMPMMGRKGMKGSVGTVNGSGKHREQSSWDRGEKVAGFRFDGSGRSFQSANVAHNTTSGHGQNPDGRKVPTNRICDCGHPESEHGFNPDQACNLCSCINPVWVSSRRTDIGNSTRFTTQDCGVENGSKGANGGWFNDNKRAGKDDTLGYLIRSGSKSTARKAASAHIAKIPRPLAQWIARAWKP